MKIRDILELSQLETVADIAKKYLSIGEKTTRSALKAAGCYSITGKKGWYLDESSDERNLDVSIYEFSEAVEKKRKEDIERLTANVHINVSNEGPEMVIRKRYSFDLDPKLMKQLKLHAVLTNQTLYEIVEQSIKDYLDQ